MILSIHWWSSVVILSIHWWSSVVILSIHWVVAVLVWALELLGFCSQLESTTHHSRERMWQVPGAADHIVVIVRK